ncbi:restriction endonuclease subunit S [Pseudarthrobacter sp. J75]|uniref:restriction endonuclease subunit S n=1 Tax=unclassified Pseudarthrobacter TaxID=2647000 RepID=UPI002E817B88|nr:MULTISPECIES: restriction endonuclease subunit S [unclassified Pseudarthrobacter]MEE2527566.1 restriction endonuclease subunit S [Pseudarthrobacter sp. J75]MEE2569736.1 restriction endonuclease subunit S [Pseudarthrobacter sp. J64]
MTEAPLKKPSGSFWTENIPVDWTEPNLRYVASIRNGTDYKEFEVEDGGYPVIGSGGVFARTSKYLHDGESVLLGRKGTVDRPLYVDGRFWTVDTMFYTHIGPRVLAKFLHYFATTIPFDYFQTSTAVPSMTQGDLGSIKVPLPTLERQRQIVEFLDRETGQIDELIGKQERLIELLGEKRQAIITHAVTKGLDPAAPTKASGVPWLGDIPWNWNTDKCSRLFRAQKGSNAAELTKETCAAIPGPFPVYSGQTANAGIMARIDKYEFDAGSDGVIFSTTVGARAMTAAHIFGKFSLSQNCMIIRRLVPLHTRFFYYQFHVLFRFERGMIPEHMQPSFRMEDLYAYSLATPPENEQCQISDYLDDVTMKLDGLASKVNSAVGLLKERRSALISAAVTGKIDVREGAAQL